MSFFSRPIFVDLTFQENIFGDDQVFTDMNDKPEVPSSKAGSSTTAVDNQAASDDDSSSHKDFDPRDYRPLEVVVSITMHDIQAHLVKVNGYMSHKWPTYILR